MARSQVAPLLNKETVHARHIWGEMGYPIFVHKHSVDRASAKGVKHHHGEMENPFFLFWSKDQDRLQNTWR